jgi:hypothetical protein
MNALKHGMASRRPLVPGEDPDLLDQRFEEWETTLVPKNPVERHLVETAVKASWKVERAERFLAARAQEQWEAAAEKDRDAVLRLFVRLFHNPQRPTELYGVGRYEQNEPRISWSADGDVDDPAPLVRQIKASAAGCEVLLDEWRTLRSRLEPGHVWLSPDKFKALRMLGFQPLDCLNVRAAAEVFVASWAIDPRGGNAYSELKCELDDREHKAFVDRVRRRWPDMLDAGNPDEARRILLAIVDGSIADLEAEAAEHEKYADYDAIRRADCLAIDNSPECVRVRTYEQSCSRTMFRSLSELSKLRRAAGRASSKPRSGLASNDDEQRRHPEFWDQQDWHPDLRFANEEEMQPDVPGDGHIARQPLPEGAIYPEQPDSPAHPRESITPDASAHAQILDNEPAAAAASPLPSPLRRRFAFSGGLAKKSGLQAF